LKPNQDNELKIMTGRFERKKYMNQENTAGNKGYKQAG
jgi:hypothetical protein